MSTAEMPYNLNSPTDKSPATSPYVWEYEKNPNLRIVQVDPLSDIDSDFVAQYTRQNPGTRIVLIDKIPLLHLSNRYPRLSESEYLRSVLDRDAIEAVQESVDSQVTEGDTSLPDSMVDRYRLAYTTIQTPEHVEVLLSLEECLERERRECQWASHVPLRPGFIDTVVARLYNTLATSLYASGDVTEAMAAQSIINHGSMNMSNKVARKNLRWICGILATRLEKYVGTRTPTLVLLDSSFFNPFILGSCADIMISKYGSFTNGVETSLSTSAETIQSIYNEIGSDINAMISLLSRIWMVQSIIDVCNVEYNTKLLEVVKVNIVVKLMGSYISQDDHTDAFDLYSFYVALSKDPNAALKKHLWIVKHVSQLYRKAGYTERAQFIEREAAALSKKK